MPHVYLKSYGVKLDVEIQAEALRARVAEILPPGWQPTNEFPEDGHFTLRSGVEGRYDVLTDGVTVATGVADDVAIHVLDSQIRARIALLAHDRIFVHAGVVSMGERGLVLPGSSFSGKSTLVAALVAAGATYYSDEFAVLDEYGLVHPYPRLLSLRDAEKNFAGLTTVEDLGGRNATTPARCAMIVSTRYVREARWNTQERNAGIGALTLLVNAIPARPRTAATVQAVSRAAAGAVVLEGDRGEADESAAILLRLLQEAI